MYSEYLFFPQTQPRERASTFTHTSKPLAHVLPKETISIYGFAYATDRHAATLGRGAGQCAATSADDQLAVRRTHGTERKAAPAHG